MDVPRARPGTRNSFQLEIIHDRRGVLRKDFAEVRAARHLELVRSRHATNSTESIRPTEGNFAQ